MKGHSSESTFFEGCKLSTLTQNFFHVSTVAPLSLSTYCSIFYYPSLSVSNRTRLLIISHVAAKIIGVPTPMLSEMIDEDSVAEDSDHPLFTYFHVLPSGRRYRCIKCKRARFTTRVMCLRRLEGYCGPSAVFRQVGYCGPSAVFPPSRLL